MFWEDVVQAGERLTGTYIMYGDEPVKVQAVESRAEGPSATIENVKTGSRTRKLLSDPKFHDFHKLPPLGYINLIGFKKPVAVYTKRIPERSRSHGLRDNRVTVSLLDQNGLGTTFGINLASVLSDDGYKHRVEGFYPTAEEIVENLPEDCSAAFSPTYAIYKDAYGLFRLFRREGMVGLISHRGLRLTRETACYQEELIELENFNIETIEVS